MLSAAWTGLGPCRNDVIVAQSLELHEVLIVSATVPHNPKMDAMSGSDMTLQ